MQYTTRLDAVSKKSRGFFRVSVFFVAKRCLVLLNKNKVLTMVV